MCAGSILSNMAEPVRTLPLVSSRQGGTQRAESPYRCPHFLCPESGGSRAEPRRLDTKEEAWKIGG